ncbi:MAG: hypothetical protein KC657_20120, partial [Myxococcales bacterium]|nr:hypothetical protein [Myxococcales bacterium]
MHRADGEVAEPAPRVGCVRALVRVAVVLPTLFMAPRRRAASPAVVTLVVPASPTPVVPAAFVPAALV